MPDRMNEINEIMEGLNYSQRQAVTAVHGPVLVVAGPGTRGLF